MEHIENAPPAAATHELAVPVTPERGLPACRISDQLTQSLIEPALDDGRDVRPGRAQRDDGWTPELIRIFLETLALCGVVSDAARAAGIGVRSAYNLRNSAKGRAFHLAWNAALQLARRTVADALMSRAIHGCVEVIVRAGEVSERHRYDNRLTMALLTRLDQRQGCEDSVAVIEQEFDQFVDIVCAGGEGAADFIELRKALSYEECLEPALLTRLDNYGRYKAGHACEIDISDIRSVPREALNAEQRLRAARVGHFDEDDEDREGEGG